MGRKNKFENMNQLANKLGISYDVYRFSIVIWGYWEYRKLSSNIVPDIYG